VTARVIGELASYLDALLRIADVADYPAALNGLQMQHKGPVRAIAAAVDASVRSIDGAIAAGANLLLVHHGLFWGGAQRIDGKVYERVKRLIANDVAVYSAHLPLDVHETFGNSRLLAQSLDLVPTDGFAAFQGAYCGVRGDSDVATGDLLERLNAFARQHGGRAIASPHEAGHRTRRWAVCTGSGANQDTLNEARLLAIDTLIVGEGPHWTAVDAPDAGIVVLYGGHYATETLGVRALAEHLGQQFRLPWTFVAAPTGL
jgi:dinuclear metal center YbgI/SA1388 family protein